MSNTLIVSGERSFYVYEVNGTNEADHANYLTRTALKSVNGPLEVYSVFHDVGEVDPNKGRFFTNGHAARLLFNAVQSDIRQYGNPLINGETLGQMQEWLEGLTHLQYQRIARPGEYSEGVVYLEYAGVQIIAERSSLQLLELMGEGEELPLYEEHYDDYFCIKVDLTEHQDEDVVAFLYVKDRDKLVAVMDELLDTWINVEVVVSNVERLKALMGIPVDQD